MRYLGSRSAWIASVVLYAGAFAAETPSRLDQVLERVVANETALAAKLQEHQPLVETYLQTVKPDPVLGTVPVKDHYFLGRLELPPAPAAGEKEKKPPRSRPGGLNLFDDFQSQTFKPESFARMLILDRGAFDRDHYDFEFVATEFLGEVRTLVFDVTPKQGKALSRLRTERFTGRIWVEDRDAAIVRYKGIYASAMTAAFHFDSWRLNAAPGLWLPSYVYTEEAEPTFKQIRLTHRGQVRIWGYQIARPSADEEFTRVLVDDARAHDPADHPGQISPVESARAWQGEAEENVLRKLERAGLLSQPGSVDKVLETVVANLEITNATAIEPPVRCRVLLTTPLESFTVGHTIVISRGLIDVLPDEASLAMVLSHELGHVLSGHEMDTGYAFNDRVLVADKQAVKEFAFERAQAEEAEADAKAIELLRNSPYKDSLQSAGLFLKALASEAQALSALIRPHFGNNQLYRMSALVDEAPQLDPGAIAQIAALPLGGRVKVDPWSARIELMGGRRVALLSAREKLAFQVTPLMPYLARFDARSAPSVSSVAPAGEAELAGKRTER